jgi:drug/metabolite transporter (DMT)-like permease
MSTKQTSQPTTNSAGDHSMIGADRTKALFAVFIVCILWGTTWLASSIGVKYVPPLELAGLRHLIGGGLYVSLFFIKKFPLPTRTQFIRIFWMSIIMFVMSSGSSVLSVVYIPSGLGAVIGAMTPIWMVLFSLIAIRGVKFNATIIIGIILGFGGIILVFNDYMIEMFDSKFALGIFYGLIASITWAIGTFSTGRHAKKMNPYVSIGWQMFFSGVILTILSFLTEKHVDILSIPYQGWYSIFYLVIIGSIVAFTAFVYALKRLPSAQVSIHAYVNPIVAIIIGNLIQNEKLTFFVMTGTAITLFGVYLVNLGFKRNASTEDD